MGEFLEVLKLESTGVGVVLDDCCLEVGVEIAGREFEKMGGYEAEMGEGVHHREI